MNFMPPQRAFELADTTLVAPAAVEAERAVIAHCLLQPGLIGAITTKLQPGDLTEPLHVEILDVIAVMAQEGRTPSLQSVLATLGDKDIGQGQTISSYLRLLMRESLVGAFAPWKDAVEVVRDSAHRRALHTTATLMLGQLRTGTGIADIAADAVHSLDDVIAASREGKRRSYDAGGAADLALAHLISDAPAYPTTGLVDLDRMVGGWPKGQLSIIAGRPGQGKSAVATSCVLRAAKAGFGVGFFSLEMLGEQLGARMMTDAAYVASAPISYESILRRESLDDRTRRRLEEARNSIAGLPIRIEEQRGLLLAEIAARSRKMASAFDRQGQKLDIIVVDHMGLIRPSTRYAGNKVNEVGEISDGLATLAKDLDVAVVALSQLSRAVEGRDEKRPSMSDLRNSGDIEQDASLIIFPYRPAYYLENKRFDDLDAERMRQDELDRVRNRIEFIVSKNRNGRIGVVDAFVDIGANAIRNAAYGGN